MLPEPAPNPNRKSQDLVPAVTVITLNEELTAVCRLERGKPNCLSETLQEKIVNFGAKLRMIDLLVALWEREPERKSDPLFSVSELERLTDELMRIFRPVAAEKTLLLLSADALSVWHDFVLLAHETIPPMTPPLKTALSIMNNHRAMLDARIREAEGAGTEENPFGEATF